MRIRVTCSICNTDKIVNGQSGITEFSRSHHHGLSRVELMANNHITFDYNTDNKPELITGSIKETIKRRKP